MKLSNNVKPISYLKTHAAKLIHEINDNNQTLVITQNGKAKAILQDIKTYENTKESIALLKILSQSTKSKKQGKYKPAKKAFNDITQKIRHSK